MEYQRKNQSEPRGTGRDNHSREGAAVEYTLSDNATTLVCNNLFACFGTSRFRLENGH